MPLNWKEFEDIMGYIDEEAGRGDSVATAQETRDPGWPQLSDEALQGLAGEFVRAIAPTTEADPAALLFQFHTAFGNIIGGGPFYKVEGSQHHTNLFTVLVGNTSKSRKGVSLSRIREVLRGVDANWEMKNMTGGLSSGEGLIWAVRDAIEEVNDAGKSVCVDDGVEDKRLLLVQHEFASVLRVLGRDGNTLSAVLRDCWDLYNLRILTKNSPAMATAAHVSLVGHITRDELLRFLTETEMANGLANRVLFVCARRAQMLPEGGELPAGVAEALAEKVGCSKQFAATVSQMKRDEAGKEVWAHTYPELSRGEAGMFGAITARAEAQALRLSMLYALLDCSATICARHVIAGLAAWEYCEASARYVFGDALGNPEADRILQALRATPEGLTRTEVSNLFGRNRNEAVLSAALVCLERAGMAFQQKDQSGGRPIERWFARVHSTK